MTQEYNPNIIFNGRVVLQANCNDPDNRIVLFTDDEHSHIREHFVWDQRYDENGKLLPKAKSILLKDITLAHLKTLCYSSINWKDEKLSKLFVDEWNWRIDND